MTAAAYATNLGHIFRDEATTNWTAIGTGGAALTAETDYFIQGVSCMSKGAFAGATKGMIYDYLSDAGGSGTDGAYIAWMSHTAPNSLANKSAGGMQFLIGSANGDYEQYYVGGADTLTFLKWELVAVSETVAGDTSTGTPSTTSESHFGGLWNLPSGGPTKGAPNVIDGIRFGRCDIVITLGTGADPEATFDGVLTALETATLRHGLLTQREAGGSFENSGLIQFGTSGTAVEFLDSNKTINLRLHDHVTANFHTWEANHASSIITLTNISVNALGGASIGRWITNNNATINWTSCNWTGLGVFGFGTNSTILSNIFRTCGVITHAGATMTNTTIAESAAAAGSGALSYNIAADPDGEMDGMIFTQGAAAHSAIQFGTAVNVDVTLRDIDFTGFGTTDDVNGAVFKFLATSGAIDLSLVGCTVGGAAATSSNISIDDTAGIAVTLVIDPVSQAFNVQDNAGANIVGARVLCETAATIASGEIFEAAVTTLTSSGTVATCTTTAPHGLVTGDYVVIRGAQPDNFNKVAQVTVTSTTIFTYTVITGLSSPATGTPVVSFAPLYGITDASGNITASRTWGANQQLKGWARLKNAVSPFYKGATFAYTVDSVAGNSTNLVLLPDE